MKKIFKIIFSIPKFKRKFVVFVLSVILAEGIAIQVFPFINREIVSMLERMNQGDTFNLSDLKNLFVVAVIVVIFHAFFGRLSRYLASRMRVDGWYAMFRTGFRKLLYHDVAYLDKERSAGYLNKVDRAAGTG